MTKINQFCNGQSLISTQVLGLPFQISQPKELIRPYQRQQAPISKARFCLVDNPLQVLLVQQRERVFRRLPLCLWLQHSFNTFSFKLTIILYSTLDLKDPCIILLDLETVLIYRFAFPFSCSSLESVCKHSQVWPFPWTKTFVKLYPTLYYLWALKLCSECGWVLNGIITRHGQCESFLSWLMIVNLRLNSRLYLNYSCRHSLAWMGL